MSDTHTSKASYNARHVLLGEKPALPYFPLIVVWKVGACQEVGGSEAGMLVEGDVVLCDWGRRAMVSFPEFNTVGVELDISRLQDGMPLG